MKISELIDVLKVQHHLHGDIQVYSGGEDYPGRVVDVRYHHHNQTYYEPNCLVLHSED